MKTILVCAALTVGGYMIFTNLTPIQQSKVTSEYKADQKVVAKQVVKQIGKKADFTVHCGINKAGSYSCN